MAAEVGDIGLTSPTGPREATRNVAVTIFGVIAIMFMMLMYALERRGRRFILGFAIGCLFSSVYGFLSGAWPFGVVEIVWAGVAVRRYRATA